MNRRTLNTSLLLAAAAGCRCQEPGTRNDIPTVALVMKSLANEFFKTMEEGARRHCAARASQYHLTANGIEDEQDVGRQIDLVGQMVAQRVDGLVIAPADSRALVSALRRPADAGMSLTTGRRSAAGSICTWATPSIWRLRAGFDSVRAADRQRFEQVLPSPHGQSAAADVLE